MVMQKAGATGESILGVASTDLRRRDVRVARAAMSHPPLPQADTHQARMPPAQWHGACEARGQCPVARQKSVEIAGGAHGVAAEDMDGLIQAILHLALL